MWIETAAGEEQLLLQKAACKVQPADKLLQAAVSGATLLFWGAISLLFFFLFFMF